MTLVECTEGRHAFDILDDADRSREIIEQALAFMRLHLLEVGRSLQKR